MWASFNLTDILALSLPMTNSKKPNQQTNKNQLYILHMPTPLHFLFSAHNQSFEKMVSFSPSQQLITPSTTPQWYRNLTIFTFHAHILWLVFPTSNLLLLIVQVSKRFMAWHIHSFHTVCNTRSHFYQQIINSTFNVYLPMSIKGLTPSGT